MALLIIMGYHFGVGWLQGGFFSLDIFYVLSGYLITGLLVSEYRKRGRIKLSAFWLRRARRLLPALLIVLVAVTLMVRFAEPAGLYPDFRMSALSALFYFSNWWQIAASGNYFVATGAVSPLTHTWSLAVEEQFYLVWPLVVLAVMHFCPDLRPGGPGPAGAVGGRAVASALEMALLYSPTANTTRLYFGTDTHAQSILVGAVLACAMTMIQMRRGHEGMAPAATSVTAPSGPGRSSAWPGSPAPSPSPTPWTAPRPFDYRGGFMLSALSAAAIIIAAVCVPGGPDRPGPVPPPLVWLGTISYGAYLWHYPVFIYLDAARTGLTGVCAAGRPLRLPPSPWPRPATTWSNARSCTGPSGARSRPPSRPSLSWWPRWRWSWSGRWCRRRPRSGSTTAMPTAERQALARPRAFTTHPVRFLLVGDSLAVTMAIGLEVTSVSRYGVRGHRQETSSAATSTICRPSSTAMSLDPVSPCRDWRTLWPKQVDPVRARSGRAADRSLGHHRPPRQRPRWCTSASRLGRPPHRRDRPGGRASSRPTEPRWCCSRCPTSTRRRTAADGTPFPENDPVRVTEFNQILDRVASPAARR